MSRRRSTQRDKPPPAPGAGGSAHAPNPTDFDWRSESGAPAPTRLFPVDDNLTADDALRRVRRGEVLLYRGDFNNARQLLTAMTKRLAPRPLKDASPLQAFRRERTSRHAEHEVLSRLVVALDPGYRLPLRRAPDVAEACQWAWGPSERPTLVSLKALLGVASAGQWQRKGLEVAGLAGRLHPTYGVFAPTRSEYLDVVLTAPPPTGKTVFDVGTGTGVLSFVLLQRGATHAVGTDIDERSVRCAQENAQRLGLASRFEARLQPLFPDGQADLVVCNPPWIPEPPKNRVDHAIFDEESRVLEGFLSGLRAHLLPGGEGWLILSNLAELLELRAPGFLEERLAAHGLSVRWTKQAKARHGGAFDRDDALHAARSREVTTLYCLAPAAQ